MEAVHGSMLLVYAVIAIALLILLITRYRVYPFLVLLIVSLLLGLAVGMPMDRSSRRSKPATATRSATSRWWWASARCSAR